MSELQQVHQCTGNTPKFTLTYKFNPDRLIYVTYSKGFRPGGINRVGDLPPYQADFLKNYEIGWKTSWADNHLRYNGAIFREAGITSSLPSSAPTA